MIKIGRFIRVLKNDGTLLLRPYLKDSIFLSDITYLFTSRFETLFQITRIQKTAKGFHVKFKDVTNWQLAEYFIDEEMSLPEDELTGKSMDLLIGFSVFNKKGDNLGTVTGFGETPEYYLLTVEGKTEFYLPFTEHAVAVRGNSIILMRDLFVAN